MSRYEEARSAMEVATTVYQEFLDQVVEAHVLSDRHGQLYKAVRAQVEAGRRVDHRPVRLMMISGKGGWNPDPDVARRYSKCMNITLLDHALSVVRGALVLAALDTIDDPDPARLERLKKVLRAVAAIAFLHDVDKDLGLERGADLPLHALEDRWTRYGLNAFCRDWDLSPDQVRALIQWVEATQAHRDPPETPVPRPLPVFMGYVALADKLDGLWCCEGLDAVLDRLARSGTLRQDLLRHWRILDMYDPHHPFLLDEFLRFLGPTCRRKTGLPPLIESHHDGRLLAVIPGHSASDVVDATLDRLASYLRRRLFGWRIVVSNRNVPEIREGRPAHAEVHDYFRHEVDDRVVRQLFTVQVDRVASLTPSMDELLGPWGLKPRWPMKQGAGKTTVAYAAPSDLGEAARYRLGMAGHLSLLLKHKEAPGLPRNDERERQLTEILGPPPKWIEAVQDRISRQTLLALWAVTRAEQDGDVKQRIWGEGGLLQRWLEGEDGRGGLRSTLISQGEEFLGAVAEHFRLRLAGRAEIVPETGRRCLFTDRPLGPEVKPIGTADQLYEVKVSAFSGRDGRPERFDSAKAETYVGPVSYVEHRLRAVVHSEAGGRREGVPALLSIPASTGLFGGLTFTDEQRYPHLSTYDLARLDPKKGRIYKGAEILRHRHRLARFETVPPRLQDQVDFLQRLLKAALRLGRPVHVFRGLPLPERAFFSFDALPRTLADLIGGCILRLEQIPPALERLDRAAVILSTRGLGVEVFNLYAQPDTRLQGLALAWAKLRDDAVRKGGEDRSNAFLRDIRTLMEADDMNESDSPVVRLGRQAAGIQRRPRAQASTNEETMVLRIALDAATGAWRLGLRDRESLIHAVAGELETNLVRRDLAAARVHRGGDSLRQGCMDWATAFVDTVWEGLLQGRPPSQRRTRILTAIYRVAFLSASKTDLEPASEPAQSSPSS